MSYRPITDVWILARSKVKYYGAYPNGFLERALPLLGVSHHDPVIHLCGGRAKLYPQKRFVEHAITVDADHNVLPDYVADLSKPDWTRTLRSQYRLISDLTDGGWPAVLADPPYTTDDHAHYAVGSTRDMPTAQQVLNAGLDIVTAGGRVGVLHYIWPRPPKGVRSIAAVAVLVGFSNRVRLFSVFEKE